LSKARSTAGIFFAVKEESSDVPEFKIYSTDEWRRGHPTAVISHISPPKVSSFTILKMKTAHHS
jgi:hypothetical protein